MSFFISSVVHLWLIVSKKNVCVLWENGCPGFGLEELHVWGLVGVDHVRWLG